MKERNQKLLSGQSPSRPRLSVSMIVRNEEKFLKECLESILGVADEIIIVDTGSTDRTIEIAEGYRASIFHFAWIDDFAAARNESLSHCTGDWVLYLDADERLTSESRDELLRLIRLPKAVAYDCLLSCEEHQPKGIVHNVAPYPRLFKRMPQFRFEGNVHEQIGPSIIRAGYSVLPSQVVIEHLGYAQSIETFVQKCDRNAELLRQQLQRHPEDTYSRFQLGNTLAMLGRHEEAIGALEQALAVANLSTRNRSTVLNILASIYADEQQIDKALEHASASLKIAPRQITARWIAIRAKIASEDFAGALVLLGEVDDLQRDRSSAKKMEVGFDTQISMDQICFWKGVCRYQTGLPEDAVNAFFEGLQHNLAYPNMLELYLRSLDTLKRPEQFIPQLDWLLNSIETREHDLNRLAQVYLKIGNLEKARIALDRCTAAGLQDDDTRGLWIDYFLAKGDLESAMKFYSEANEVGADSHLYHKASLQLMLLTKDFAAAMKHVDCMSRGVETMTVDTLRNAAIDEVPVG